MITIKNLDNMTLALAGVVQAATLVNELAVHGTYDKDAFNCLIQSILQQNPNHFLDIYGNLSGLQLGLKQIIKLIQKKVDNVDKNISRYIISLFYLQKKLKNSRDRLNQIGRKIQQVNQQANYFSIDHPTVYSHLAQVYLDNISTFSYRIHVMGNPTFINNPDNLNKIRALLLAGIRSAVAFEQAGGKRWHLFLLRNQFVKSAQLLLNGKYSFKAEP